MDRIHDFITKEYPNLMNDLKKIALVPSPPFKEKRRVMFLRKYLGESGLKNSEIDAEGNLVLKEKGKSKKQVIWSAHVDTVFPEDTELQIKEKDGRIYCPGIADNAISIVSLLYLIKYIKRYKINLADNNIFLFNVGEEGLGDLRGIKYFFDHINRNSIKAHICIEGHDIGRLTTKVVGSSRMQVSIKCEGGHAWRDYGKPNAIIVASQLINDILKIPLPREPKTTMNFGTISGGTSINAIPSNAEFTLEARSLNKPCLRSVVEKIRGVLDAVQVKGVKITTKIVGERPCGELHDKYLPDIVSRVHKELNIKTLEEIGSTDSNYPISLGLPSVTIGITDAEKTHSDAEFMYVGPVKRGFGQLLRIFEAVNSGK